jgi:hypothetical protein
LCCQRDQLPTAGAEQPRSYHVSLSKKRKIFGKEKLETPGGNDDEKPLPEKANHGSVPKLGKLDHKLPTHNFRICVASAAVMILDEIP